MAIAIVLKSGKKISNPFTYIKKVASIITEWKRN